MWGIFFTFRILFISNIVYTYRDEKTFIIISIFVQFSERSSHSHDGW
jgi:hypothetical protein